MTSPQDSRGGRGLRKVTLYMVTGGGGFPRSDVTHLNYLFLVLIAITFRLHCTLKREMLWRLAQLINNFSKLRVPTVSNFGDRFTILRGATKKGDVTTWGGVYRK